MTNKYNDFFRPYHIPTTGAVWFNETKISKKEELKEGDIVTLRNGDRLVYLGDESFADLSDDLSYINCWNDKPNYDYDIVKVERPAAYYTAFEREDKAREMTIKEISEILGYEVKVVKEK